MMVNAVDAYLLQKFVAKSVRTKECSGRSLGIAVLQRLLLGKPTDQMWWGFQCNNKIFLGERWCMIIGIKYS